MQSSEGMTVTFGCLKDHNGGGVMDGWIRVRLQTGDCFGQGCQTGNYDMGQED